MMKFLKWLKGNYKWYRKEYDEWSSGALLVVFTIVVLCYIGGWIAGPYIRSNYDLMEKLSMGIGLIVGTCGGVIVALHYVDRHERKLSEHIDK